MKKLLYIVIAPLFAIDWLLVTVANILEVVHNSIKEIILVAEKYINASEPTLPKPDQ
jgi:hypothetical protein